MRVDVAPGRTEAAFVSADELAALAEPWDALAQRALEPSVFLCRWMVEARLRHLPDRIGSRILAAFRPGENGRRLVGLTLLVRPRGRRVNPLPVLRAAQLYAPLSTPLIDPEGPGETWQAMLAALDRAGIAALALPEVSVDGPVAAIQREVAAAMRAPIVSLGGYRRAILEAGSAAGEPGGAAPEGGRRRSVERSRRRLRELGRVEFVVAASGPDLAEALERFVSLEASGWKGKAGTDLSRAPGGAAYFRDAAANAPPGAFRVASLLLDGRPVAAGIVLVAGRRAFYVKTAYDETLARHSPGLLLSLDLTAHLRGDPGIDDADSVADADQPMIERIWAERLTVESLFVATRPGGGLAFSAALAAERGREGAIRAAKRAVARFRRG